MNNDDQFDDNVTTPYESEDNNPHTEAAETHDENSSDNQGARVAHHLRGGAVDGSNEVLRGSLKGMYRSWFLDYASYVILERAVPHIEDGLKPVQRRILHSMKTLDDGRMNKVANIVGNTMQYHPHGDASIYEALVQLGQKDLLIETQGNWGNILTGASAAAGRYIEARLSKFALDVVFSPKVTEWTPSYDGRKKEPVTFPTKFPLLLAQGVEGIAVGLSCKILPHNFREILEGAIKILKGERPVLYPDFPTGGFIDVSRYNDGARGGALKIRAKIEKLDSKTLAITEIPYGRTTSTLIESILKAFEAGKIKIRKVDDNTAAEANILVYLQPGTSSDKTIDALYAFTDCEISVSPNCVVIADDKPRFMGVTDVLEYSAHATRETLRRELEIELNEVSEQLFFADLERIFIEERIYKDKEYEQSRSREEAIVHIDRRLEPWKPKLLREVTNDDMMRLFEIKMGRIIRHDADAAENAILKLKARIEELKNHLSHLTEYTISWFETLLEKYADAYPRRTVIRNFDNIAAAAVAEASEKLYINREEGFIGTALKKDEFVCSCSSIDDIILFYRDGRYKIVRVAEKLFVGPGVIHVAVFKRGDTRTIYNVIYRNGQNGPYNMKRFAVTGVTRDKEYNLTPGAPGTRLLWFTANPNGEAETVRVTLKPKLRLKTLHIEVDFSTLAIKGRGALGNLVTKNEVSRVSLKERGTSTLGGLKVWFDDDVLRLNYDGRGRYIGEFSADDKVLVVMRDGRFLTTGYEASNHYDEGIMRIERFDPAKVWTVALFDADQGFTYLKRFTFELSSKPQSFIGDNPASKILAIADGDHGVEARVSFGGTDADREPIDINAEEFIAVKSFKAKGKRLSNYTVEAVSLTVPETEDTTEVEAEVPEIAPDNADVAPDTPTLFDDEN